VPETREATRGLEHDSFRRVGRQGARHVVERRPALAVEQVAEERRAARTSVVAARLAAKWWRSCSGPRWPTI
jgi:hypothetical protein